MLGRSKAVSKHEGVVSRLTLKRAKSADFVGKPLMSWEMPKEKVWKSLEFSWNFLGKVWIFFGKAWKSVGNLWRSLSADAENPSS